MGTPRIVAPEGDASILRELELDISFPNVFVIRSLKMELFGRAFIISSSSE